MKTLNFASIPKFCISLKHSSRRHTVAAEFERVGIKNVAFFDAIDKRDVVVPELSVKRNIVSDSGHMPGILACMMSHVELIKKAKDLKLPEICIFEDDVVFSDDFNERIAYIEALDFDYDLFTLGGHFDKPESKFTPPDASAKKSEDPHIFRVFKQGGTYAYIIKSSVYDFVIRNCTYNYGMDQFYADHVYKRFNCYAFVPFLCACTNGKSEITGADGGYENIDWYFEKKAIFQEKPEAILPERKKVHVSAPTGSILKQATGGFIDLTDCTFITAVRIDSPDREFNFLRVMQYICDNFVTNIMIKESDKHSKVVELMQRFDRKKCKIDFVFEKTDSTVFHRTKMLNEMLAKVPTKITVNYDIDVFMPIEAYVHARDKILAGWDLVYPFKLGDDIQKMVTVPEHLKNSWGAEHNLFNPQWLSNHQTYCGHVQFFNTRSYIAGGMENEGMISYGPEDRERCERFQRLGYKVCWMDSVVYHIEHSRDENSSTRNPHFGNNDALMDRIRNMSEPELREYYKNVPYLKKYTHATV